MRAPIAAPFEKSKCTLALAEGGPGEKRRLHMASEAEVRYHRSFLSPYHWENFDHPTMWEKGKRTADEIEAIRLKDPKEFENTRKSLAVLLKVQYMAGGYVARTYIQDANASGWVSGQPSDYQVAQVLKPKNPPQTAVRHPTTGAIAIPNVPFGLTDAYVDGKPLHPIQMYQKTDQQFETYASPWELIWSNLSYPYTRGFKPVIDSSYNVIGHYGEMDGGPVYNDFYGVGIMFPRGMPGAAGSDLRQLLDKKVPVFVHSHTGLPPGWEIGNFYSSEHKIEVRTGIDGEVVDFQISNRGFLVQPWYSPFDIFVAGRILVTLTTKVGTMVASSLMRRATANLAGRAVLNGATEALAKDGIKAAEKDAATMAAGKAVSTGVSTGAFKLPVEHLSRRTLIMGEDLAEFRQWFAQSNPVSGFYDVFMHADANSFQILVKENGKNVWKNVSVREVANAVKPQLAPGDKIRLFACDVGITGGPAQQFATEINHTVWAPTTKTYAAPTKWAPSTINPAAPTSTFVPAEGGKFKEFVPLRTNVNVVKRAK